MTTDNSDRPAEQASHRGYPLGALFVFVATCAVLSVAITPLVRELATGEIDGFRVAVVIITTAAGSTLLGGTIGVISFRTLTGGAIGGGMGMAIGLVAGLMAQTPLVQLPKVAMAMLVGSGIVVLLAFWMRRRE